MTTVLSPLPPKPRGLSSILSSPHLPTLIACQCSSPDPQKRPFCCFCFLSLHTGKGKCLGKGGDMWAIKPQRGPRMILPFYPPRDRSLTQTIGSDVLSTSPKSTHITFCRPPPKTIFSYFSILWKRAFGGEERGSTTETKKSLQRQKKERFAEDPMGLARGGYGECMGGYLWRIWNWLSISSGQAVRPSGREEWEMGTKVVLAIKLGDGGTDRQTFGPTGRMRQMCDGNGWEMRGHLEREGMCCSKKLSTDLDQGI